MEQTQPITANRVPLQGAPNTRDLGGYPTLDGRAVLPHKLIRSGALGSITDQDRKILTQEYGVKTIIDLRTRTERDEKPDPILPGVKAIINPIFAEAHMGITHEGEEKQSDNFLDSMVEQLKDAGEHPQSFMGGLYAVLIREDYCVNQFRRFFALLLEQTDGAVLWHCSAGKDRVGTSTALLLSALNVDRELIMQDYLATNYFLRQEVERRVEYIAQKTSDPRLLNGIRVFSSVHESYLNTIFDTIDKLYGSLNIFLEDKMGLTEDKRVKLQKMYLTE